MNRSAGILVILCAALLCGIFPTGAWADVWNKKTVVSFPEPVEVPGAVLEPGPYVIKLVDSPSNRHIVRITNEDENRVYATILAIPNYRLEPAEKSVFTFYEMPGGRPQALRAWFYPGDNVGQEFPYPKTRATEIARVTGQHVPSAPEASRATASPGPPPVEPPEEKAAAAPAEAAPSQDKQPSAETAGRAAAKATEAAETRAPAADMPETASHLPLLALIGLALVAAAIGLRRAARWLA